MQWCFDTTGQLLSRALVAVALKCGSFRDASSVIRDVVVSIDSIERLLTYSHLAVSL